MAPKKVLGADFQAVKTDHKLTGEPLAHLRPPRAPRALDADRSFGALETPLRAVHLKACRGPAVGGVLSVYLQVIPRRTDGGFTCSGLGRAPTFTSSILGLGLVIYATVLLS